MSHNLEPLKPTTSKRVPPHAARLFKEQLRDFLSFLTAPDFKRGYGRETGDGWFKDWQLTLPWKRMFQWAALMWVINILLLGPIAVFVSSEVGADNRLRFSYILIPLAVIWAPLVEEILFRYNLRRPLLALWMVPVMIFVLLNQATITATVTLITVLAIVLILYPSIGLNSSGQRWRLPFGFLRAYRKHFVWIMHLAVFSFAYIHVFNYELSLAHIPITVLLVLPQWVCGLVLMWMRMRYGIANAIYLHAIYNAGPVIAVMLLHFLGQSEAVVP